MQNMYRNVFLWEGTSSYSKRSWKHRTHAPSNWSLKRSNKEAPCLLRSAKSARKSHSRCWGTQAENIRAKTREDCHCQKSTSKKTWRRVNKWPSDGSWNCKGWQAPGDKGSEPTKNYEQKRWLKVHWWFDWRYGHLNMMTLNSVIMTKTTTVYCD